MNLPKLSDIDVSGKRVIVRMDLDLPSEAFLSSIASVKEEVREGLGATDTHKFFRLRSALPTLRYLIGKNCKIIIIGHRGRPEGKHVEQLSLKPVSKLLEKLLEDELGSEQMEKIDMQVMENLRFSPEEEGNDESYARQLAGHGDFYVNEAFSVSHREHVSIVGIPKFLPHAAGFHFVREVETLSRVREKPERPVVMVISGVKDDKLKYIEGFLEFADKILIGGRLPDYIHDDSSLRKNEKVVVAGLIADKEDISIHSIEVFEKEISKAKTIVLSGPLGKFEDEGHRQGTKRVFESVAKSSAFKVAGGGDTEAAISTFNLTDRFDWISVGGGAMLEFLARGTLPGIQAIKV